MKKKVYFVRHGQSVGNVDGIFHGPQVPLTKKGEEQAQFIARRCKDLQFDIIIASTMERATRTGMFIHEATGKPIEFTDDLVERIEPSSIVNRSSKDPDVFRDATTWTNTFFTVGERFQDGENFELMRTRAQKVLRHFMERNESHIVAVTHGFFLRMILACITFGNEVTPDQFKSIFLSFRTTNTGMTLVESTSKDVWYQWMEGRPWVVRAWNDYAHLGDHTSHE